MFKGCVYHITIHVVWCCLVCQPHALLKIATIDGQNMQEAYNIYSVINSHIFMSTCWFYSHNELSVHGHELFKTDKCPTGKGTHAYKNTKEDLHRTNATIWFNKLRRSYHLTPNYIEVTINGYIKQCHNIMKSGVMLADTTTPHCLDGDLIYAALQHPSLTQFSTDNFISALYCNII